MADINEKREGYTKTRMGWIPTEWTGNKIGDYIKFSGGSQPPRNTFVFEPRPGYVRLVQIRDFRTDKYKTYIPKDSARKTFDESDIMIGRYGPPLFQIFKGLSGAYNVALIKATPNKKYLDKNYTWYILNRPELQTYLESLSQRTGGQTGIEMDRLKAYPLPLPPLPEQQKIASILSTWDAAIRQLDRLIERKQTLKKGLMQQLLTGRRRFPEFVPAGGTRYQETKLGMVPEDWEVVKAEKVFSRVSIKGKEEQLLAVTQDMGVIPRDLLEKRVVMPDGSTSNYKLVKPGNFVISLRSFQGGLEFSEYTGLVSPAYTVLTYDESFVDKVYFRYYFKSYLFIERLSSAVIGIRDGKQISFPDFKIQLLPLPPKMEQKRIGEVLCQFDGQIKMLETKKKQLENQKKGLMQQLLTGAVRVRP